MSLEIWDELRRKYVVLTPEEWVRQHVAHYLMQPTWATPAAC